MRHVTVFCPAQTRLHNPCVCAMMGLYVQGHVPVAASIAGSWRRHSGFSFHRH